MAPRRIDPTHFSPDTKAFIGLLGRHNVRYVIAGGEAVIFHGHARLTGDVDFFFDKQADNPDRLYAALREFWGGKAPGLTSSDDLRQTGLVLQYGVPPNRIDLINDIDGVSFDEVWTGRVDAVMSSDADDIRLPFIGRAELILNKAASGRPKDLDDLEYLLR